MGARVRVLAAAFALAGIAAASNLLTRASVVVPYPPPTEMRLAAADAVTSASLLSLGMRRLAADMAFIQLIIYYGSRDAYHEGRAHPEGHEGCEHGHHEEDGEQTERGEQARELGMYFGEGSHDHRYTYGGSYSELGPRLRRIMDMDPFWKYPVLYVCGALAFNMKRPQEALELLTEARRHLPTEKQYLAYMAAIAFAKDGDKERVVAELTPLMDDPDVPTMVRNMVAYLNVELGRKREAVRLYLQILESRDENYHHVARRALEKLGTSVQ